MRLLEQDFNDLLNDIGEYFAWRRGYACPCINPSSGSPKPNCPHCSGKGRMWGDPVSGSAGIVGRSQMRNFAAFGQWDAGDVMLSIPSDSPLYDMGQFDRVVASNKSEPFSITLVHGINDAIRFPVIYIERVNWVGPEGQLVEGDPPNVSSSGVITWLGRRPPAQTTYSITGRRTPEYYCYQEIPFDRPMHFGEPLPRRVVLRRFDLYGR